MKKLFSVLMVALLAIAAKAEITVYFDNSASNWDQVSAFVWGPDDLGGWPGTMCEKVVGENAYWAIKLPADTYGGLIFNNNNGGEQTRPDITNIHDGYVYSTSDIEGKVYTGPTETIPNGSVIIEPKDGKLYIMGTPTGWSEPSVANADKFVDWTLVKAAGSDYIYEGEFQMPAAPMFRFAGELGGWDCQQYAAQAADAPIATTLTDGVYEGSMTLGKGSWELSAFEGGKLKITVDVENMTVKFEGENDGPVPPTPDPTLPEHVYLIGNNNAWGTNNAPEADSAVEGVYTWNKITMNNAADAEVGYFSFITLLSDNWDMTNQVPGVNDSNRYGAVEANTATTLDQAMEVKLYEVNVNASSAASWTLPAGDYKMVLDLNAMTLIVSKVGDDPNPPTPPTPDPTLPEHVYLIGDNNAWGTNTAPEADTAVEGVYTWNKVVMNNAADAEVGYFSFITALAASWDMVGEVPGVNDSNRYGAMAPNTATTLGQAMEVKLYEANVDASSAASWTLPAGNYKMVLDLNAMTLTVTEGEGGIEGIEASEEGEAVYYTLQGVRVANPTSGIYVKVANGKAQKVAIR